MLVLCQKSWGNYRLVSNPYLRHILCFSVTLVMNKLHKSGLLSIVLAIIAAFLIINVFFRQEQNFAELALGEETKAYLATDSLGHPIHLIGDSLSQLLLTGWQKRGKNEVALVLGNSQTHSINQLKEGDQTYVGLLHQKWRHRKLDVVAHPGRVLGPTAPNKISDRGRHFRSCPADQ